MGRRLGSAAEFFSKCIEDGHEIERSLLIHSLQYNSEVVLLKLLKTPHP